MEALISHVKATANKADESGRKKIIDGLRDLAYSIESPEDTMQRIMFQVLKLPCTLRPFVALPETNC
jgi:demethylsterigmatocystin 6-O-methyltransferase